jgi:dihydrofolate reductase
MPRTVYYAAASLDGRIADRDGGTSWLRPFFAPELGFHQFFESVGAVVLGRATYDQATSSGHWPYAGKKGLVVTSRSLKNAPEGVGAARVEELKEAVGALRRELARDVWIVGGAKTAGACLAAGLVDELEIYVVPRLLGAGLPLVPDLGSLTALRLIESRTFSSGVVLVRSAVERPGP